MCCCHPFHADKGWDKIIDACLQQPSLRQALSRGKMLGVGVQNVVGEFCKHVCIRVALRMVLRGRLGAAPEL